MKYTIWFLKKNLGEIHKIIREGSLRYFLKELGETLLTDFSSGNYMNSLLREAYLEDSVTIFAAKNGYSLKEVGLF